MTDLPPRLAVASVLLGCCLFAQEYRHADIPLFAGACYDSVRQRVVALGLSGYGHEWDGVTWRRTPDRGAPASRCYSDPLSGRLFAFPGDRTTGLITVRVRIGNRWQSVPAGSGPSITAAIAFDTARGEMVAFGGEGPPGVVADTWAFDGTSWLQRPTSNAPPARRFASMAFDSTNQRVVLFGGETQTTTFDDTWQWDGIDWSPLPTPVRPNTLPGSPMVYDSARQRLVLLGNTMPPGTAGGAGVVEHWEYDGSNWLQQAALPTAMQNRLVYVAVFDETRGETLLLDSSDASARHGDVWAFDGTSWQPRPGFGSQPWARTGGSATDAPAGASSVLVFGGLNSFFTTAGPLDELWTFDSSGWNLTSTGTVPRRMSAAMWSQGNATFVFGGLDATFAPLGDTWVWNGSSWAQVATATAPSAREAAVVVYDVVANLAVLFGGSDAGTSLGDTWTFDGTAWQQAVTAVQPPPRVGHAMAHDLVRDRVVLFGGQIGPWYAPGSDTWEWDGSTWQQVPTTAAPPSLGTMTFDATLQQIVYAATDGQYVQLWTYDGVDWTQLPAAGTVSDPAPLIEWAAVAATGLIGRLTVVGGYGVRQLLPSPAGVEHYGSSCGNPGPVLAANSLPVPGTAGFALEVTEAGSVTPVALIGAAASASLPVLGCTLLVDPTGVALLTLSLANGLAAFGVPLPANPTLIGADFYFQSAALTSFTPLGLAFSAGLRVRIGE